MPESIDLTGKKFGYLSVLHFAGHRGGKRVWVCKCDCGKEVIRDTYYLTHQSDVSCGCVRYKKVSESKKTHGQCGTKLYKIWEAMKRRCDSPKADRYPRYGGRGIKYCDEWNKFIPFYEWAIKAGYKEGLSIDRINPDGNYEPNNCRWITMAEQANNTSQNRHVSYGGRSMTVSEFANAIKQPYMKVYQELFKLKWSAEKCASEAQRDRA